MAIDQHGDAMLDGVSIRSLPKVSLHDHLDGALRPQTIIELAEAVDLEVPESDADDLADWFEDQSDSGSLVEYLKTFDLTTAVMQTADGLRRVAREFVEDLAADGVIYGEVRWAPEQHLAGGLSLEEAVEAVQEGIEEGEDEVSGTGRDIRVGQLITAMRHTDRSLEIAKLAVDFRGRGAVGFDIAGPEDGFPASNHRAAFDYLASAFFPVTVHAGEAAGLDSIRSALIDGRALRLGHGVRIAEDLEIVQQKGDEVLGTFGDLHYQLGFAVTVNVDNRTMSRTSLTRELALLAETFDYRLEDLEAFQLNAAAGAFLSVEEREELIELIGEGFSA